MRARLLPLLLLGVIACGDERVEALEVKLRIAPDAIDFGAIPVGAQVKRTVSIINDGNGPYSPSSAPAIAGEGFEIVAQCPLPLAPGAFCEAEIAFRPKVEGEAAAALHVEAPAGPGEAPLAVALSGVGEPAEVLVAPAALDFGSLQVGAGKTLTFTVESRAGAPLDLPLTISGGATSGFFLADDATSTTLHLEPGDILSVDVEFVPSRGGPFADAALVELCGAGCGPAVALTGAGQAPRIDVQPRSADLGEVAVGSAATADLTVANVGAGDLVLLRLDVLAPAALTADGALAVDDAELPLTIAEGESATLTVRWAPSAARGQLDATLRIRSNDPVSPDVLVPVTGEAPGPALELLPRVASFGVLDEGDERTLDVVLRSIGTVPADVASVTVVNETGGAPFAVDGAAPPPGPLGPGEALLFRVRATASAAAVDEGGAEGRIVVAAQGLPDLETPLAFFSGTAGCQPRAPLPNAALGSVVLGQGTTGSVIVQNVGDAACLLDDSGAPEGLVSDPGFSFSTVQARTIAPGTFGEVAVAFDALDVGQRSAFLRLTYTDAPAPLLVSATARGVTGTVVGEPPLLEMGPVLEGCPVDPRIATFVNRGSAPSTITELRTAPAPGTPANVFAPGAVNLPAPLGPGAALIAPVTVATLPPAGLYEAEVQAVVEAEVAATVRVRLTVQEPGEPVTETFEVGDVRAVDVLFVVDDSGSMEDDQQLLAGNFDRFIETAFEDEDLRFHIGVTTTDVIGGTGGPLVASYLTDAISEASLEAAFADMALVGTAGNGVELGLEAMRRAVDELANTVNAGFLRDDAALSIVIVSDEEDNGFDTTLDPSLVRPVETYIEVLSALKSNLANTPVLVSVVVTPGFATRYETVAQAFGGVTLDITSPTWGEQLSTIGAATFGLQRLFRLGSPPQPGTVVVTVDGTGTTAFSVDGDSVILDDAPDPGALVEITYRPGCA